MSNFANDPMMQMLLQSLANQPKGTPPMQQPPNMWQQPGAPTLQSTMQGLNTASNGMNFIKDPKGAMADPTNPFGKAYGQMAGMAGKSPGAAAGTDAATSGASSSISDMLGPLLTL